MAYKNNIPTEFLLKYVLKSCEPFDVLSSLRHCINNDFYDYKLLHLIQNNLTFTGFFNTKCNSFVCAENSDLKLRVFPNSV